jgi:hypothetical protein
VSLTFPTALQSGPVELLRIRADVPATAPYRGKHVLRLHAAALNNGAIPVLTDHGVHVVTYFGDASGNAAYSSLDAQRVLRVAVGLDDGFSSHPLVDPRLIGDITANGAISSLDATRILQMVVGLAPSEIPPLPGVLSPVFVSGPDPIVRIGPGLRGRPGEGIIVPVLIDDADGLQAVDLVVSVDPAIFEIVRVRGGSVALDGTIVTNLEGGAGRVTLGAALALPRRPGSGTLVELELRVRPDARAGRSLIDLEDASLNERGLTLGLTPRPGRDATDSTATISGSPRRRH